MDENKNDFRFWYANNPKALASVENAIRKFLPTGKGIEMKCGKYKNDLTKISFIVDSSPETKPPTTVSLYIIQL